MRFLAPLAGAALALALAASAQGHAAPERFEPAPGTVLDAAPARVEGWFTQEIRRQEGASFIRVFDRDGMQVDDGAPVVDDDDRRHMHVGLAAGLPDGRYMAAWQTLSDEDDELDGGCFWFFVGEAAAAEAHAERLRIDAAEGCPLDLEEASALFGRRDTSGTAITIDVPPEVDGDRLTVRLSTEGVTIRSPVGSGRDPAFGHYHLYLDQVPVLEHSHDGEGMDMGAATATPEALAYARDIMVVEDSYTLTDLEPGVHMLTAALFYDDHTPFQPPVTQSVTFKVTDGGGGPGTATAAAIGVAAGAGGLLLGAAAAFGVARRRRA